MPADVLPLHYRERITACDALPLEQSRSIGCFLEIVAGEGTVGRIQAMAGFDNYADCEDEWPLIRLTSWERYFQKVEELHAR